MNKIGNLFQSADWKTEKHVPVIECPDSVEADEIFEVTVSLGKEVAHPNTTSHHIRWIQVFFQPKEEKFPYQVGNFEFTAHGEHVDGADKGPVYTSHTVTASMKVKKPGILRAISFCNIHGLWENMTPIEIK
jgi:superoxide reductase